MRAGSVFFVVTEMSDEETTADENRVEATLADLERQGPHSYFIKVGQVYVKDASSTVGMVLTADHRQACHWHTFQDVSAAYHAIDRWLGFMPTVEIYPCGPP